MSEYQQLLEQRKELDKRIADARKHELSSAIEQVRKIVAEFDLTADVVFGRSSPKANINKGSVVPVKYRDPETGSTWTGRGKAPRWIADKDRDQFLV